MATPKWLNPQVSVGNLLSVATVIIGLSLGWQSLVGVTQTNARDIATVTRRVDALETNLATLVREINADRLSQTEILTDLRADMRYTRQAVDEIRASTK